VPWRGRERDQRTCLLRVGQAYREARRTSTLRSASAWRFRGASSRSCCRSGGGRMCGCSRRGGCVVWCVCYEFSSYQSILMRRRRMDRSETYGLREITLGFLSLAAELALEQSLGIRSICCRQGLDILRRRGRA